MAPTHASARQWATQLVAWDRPHAHRLTGAAPRYSACRSLRRTLVPVLPGGAGRTDGRGRGGAAVAGEEPLVLTPRAVVERTGSAVIDESLGDRLLSRLASLLAELDCPLDRPLTNLADIAEQLVAGLPLPPTRGAIAKWNAVYDDLARMFDSEPAVLRGRRMLLAADGTVRHTNGDRAGAPAAGHENNSGKRKRRSDRQIAFFPPARGDGFAEA